MSRQWIAILEDTPEEKVHWKNTRGCESCKTCYCQSQSLYGCTNTSDFVIPTFCTGGHDHLGTFNSWNNWMMLFSKLHLKPIKCGAIWAGSKSKPSPYFCERAYFILEAGGVGVMDDVRVNMVMNI